eukprot:6794408-Pyramimonas_sp.AAC.1
MYCAPQSPSIGFELPVCCLGSDGRSCSPAVAAVRSAGLRSALIIALRMTNVFDPTAGRSRRSGSCGTWCGR